MCLTNLKPVTPSEDIVVYKVFCKDPDTGTNKLFSPMYEYSWDLSGKNRCFKDHAFSTVHPKLSDGAIYGGAFHSFMHEQDAKHYAWILTHGYNYYNLIVRKCIIPKDSEFICEGFFYDDNCLAYASSELIICNENE